MSTVIVSIAYSVALLVSAAVLLLVINRVRDAIWRRRNPPEKLAAERDAYETRIVSPDWAFYERHLQRPAPSALRELYADRALVCTGGVGFDKTHYISSFEPLDEAALVDTAELFGFDVVPFANSDGDIIYLRPGASEPDSVYISYHDGDETKQLAPDVSVFLQRLRAFGRSA